MKFTKKEMMNAFLLYLDDSLKRFECEKIEKQGNSECYRCDLCMMKQYIQKVRNGELPRVAKENSGTSYPTIN